MLTHDKDKKYPFGKNYDKNKFSLPISMQIAETLKTGQKSKQNLVFLRYFALWFVQKGGIIFNVGAFLYYI